MPGDTTLPPTKVPSLATDLFHASLTNYIDYNKPDPIARRQLESWKMNWSEGSTSINDMGASADENEVDANAVKWNPKHRIEGALEILGDYISVTLEIKCIWADGDAASDDRTEDGRLSYTCRLKSGRFIENKDGEEKSQRKVRKKMISRLRQDSYIAKLLELEEGNKSPSRLFLARANIYVNASKFELEERVDVSESAAETLRRALWPSTASSLDVVDVILGLPTLPCRNADRANTTTRLANRAKLRLLEDAMLDECEKEGDDQLIEDLSISHPTAPSIGHKEESQKDNRPRARNGKKQKR